MSSINLLHECHARIRRYSAGLRALADLADPRDPRVPPTAADCARYFGEALLLHASDEDHSLLPRLALPPALAAEAEALRAEHQQIEAALPALLADLRALADATPAADGFPTRARAFTTLLLGHIAREEEGLLPYARDHLSPQDDAAIVAELRARRTGR